MNDATRLQLFTIGHSDRSIEEFIALLQSAQVTHLVDVRRYPGSRRNPQFNGPNLSNSLTEHGMSYLWEGDALGGHRDAPPFTQHTGLRSSTMRAYAAHMENDEFRDTVDRLTHTANSLRVAIMCAERNPEHCHRSLVSDYLSLKGVEVLHLMAPGQLEAHLPHPCARIQGRSLSYDGNAQLAFEL